MLVIDWLRVGVTKAALLIAAYRYQRTGRRPEYRKVISGRVRTMVSAETLLTTKDQGVVKGGIAKTWVLDN